MALGPGGHPISNGLSETQRAQNLPLLFSEEEAGIDGIVFCLIPFREPANKLAHHFCPIPKNVPPMGLANFTIELKMAIFIGRCRVNIPYMDENYGQNLCACFS